MSSSHTEATNAHPYVDPEAAGAIRLLADYEVQRTGNADGHRETASPASLNGSDHFDPSTAPHPRVQGAITPAWWPTQFRRIPPYTPVNRNLDYSERPIGEDRVISFFLTTVFCGCGLMSTYAWAWRNSLGRINNKIFHYEIGGEY